jgi:hypothetical protein
MRTEGSPIRWSQHVLIFLALTDWEHQLHYSADTLQGLWAWRRPRRARLDDPFRPGYWACLPGYWDARQAEPNFGWDYVM